MQEWGINSTNILMVVSDNGSNMKAVQLLNDSLDRYFQQQCGEDDEDDEDGESEGNDQDVEEAKMEREMMREQTQK